MIDWKIQVGGLLAVLLGVWLAHRLSSSRSEDETYKRKAREFKELLVPFVRELESVDAHPPFLVAQQFPKQDEAARKLALYMGRKKKLQFLERWERYAEYYREKQAQGMMAMFATEVDDLSEADPGKAEAERYILEQTTRRRKEVTQLVEEALDVL